MKLLVLALFLFSRASPILAQTWSSRIAMTGPHLKPLAYGQFATVATGDAQLVCHLEKNYANDREIHWTWTVDDVSFNSSHEHNYMEKEPGFVRKYQVVAGANKYESVLHVTTTFGFRPKDRPYEKIKCIANVTGRNSISRGTVLYYTPGNPSVFAHELQPFDYKNLKSLENTNPNIHRVIFKERPSHYGETLNLSCVVNSHMADVLTNRTGWEVKWYAPSRPNVALDDEDTTNHLLRYSIYVKIDDIHYAKKLELYKFSPEHYTDYMCRVLADGQPISEVLFHIDEEFKCYRETQRCYKVTPIVGTYDEVADWCKKHDSQMVSIRNQVENEIVSGLAENVPPPSDIEAKTSWVYIGLKHYQASDNEALFDWDDGEKMNYTNWQPNTPAQPTSTRSGFSSYIAINPKVGFGGANDVSGFEPGKWDDLHETWNGKVALPGICYFDLKARRIFYP